MLSFEPGLLVHWHIVYRAGLRVAARLFGLDWRKGPQAAQKRSPGDGRTAIHSKFSRRKPLKRLDGAERGGDSLRCWSGGIGRRTGLKIPRPYGHVGSTPTSSTNLHSWTQHPSRMNRQGTRPPLRRWGWSHPAKAPLCRSSVECDGRLRRERQTEANGLHRRKTVRDDRAAPLTASPSFICVKFQKVMLYVFDSRA